MFHDKHDLSGPIILQPPPASTQILPRQDYKEQVEISMKLVGSANRQIFQMKEGRSCSQSEVHGVVAVFHESPRLRHRSQLLQGKKRKAVALSLAPFQYLTIFLVSKYH